MLCKLCNKNFGRQGGSFNKHLLNVHGFQDYLSYILFVDYNNIHPVCLCGCGQKITFHNNKFMKFIHGHNGIYESNRIKESRPVEEIINLYISGMTGDEISNLFKLDRSYVFKILKENSITRNESESKIKFKIDDTIFEQIDSEEKAYWFGFLYADGYVNSSKNSVSLCLSNCDINILEKFNKFLKTDKKIRNNNGNSSKVVIENKKICGDLTRNGLIQAKTHILKFPSTISSDLVRHFIRGYFDGDGCVTYGKKLSKNCQISITSTLNFLNEIDKYIDINFVYTKRHKERDDKIYTIVSGGICNLIIFYDYLYRDSNIFLERKKLKFEEWFKYYFENTNISKKTKELKNKFNI